MNDIFLSSKDNTFSSDLWRLLGSYVGSFCQSDLFTAKSCQIFYARIFFRSMRAQLHKCVRVMCTLK